MPRRIRLRETDGGRLEGAGGRRAWLTVWKRRAVAQLPPGAPREVRVRVRAAVERALARFGQEDDSQEVHDLVQGVVEDALDRMEAEAEQAARERRKQAILDRIPALLSLALARFPRGDVAAMLKRPGYSRARLTQGLRGHLEARLTGDETWEQVRDEAVAWVDGRLAEQPRLSRALAKGAASAAGLGALALQDPKVQEAVSRGLTKAREKVQELWARWTKPSGPPAES